MDKNGILKKAVREAAASGQWANADFEKLERKVVPSSAIEIKPVKPAHSGLRVDITFLEFSRRSGGKQKSNN